MGGRSTMIILGGLVAALVLLGVVCGGWFLLHGTGHKNNTAGTLAPHPSSLIPFPL